MAKNMSLEARLRAQLNSESQSSEELTQNALQDIGKKLNNIVKSELAIIENDFHRLSKKAYWRIQLKQLMWPMVFLISFLVMLFAGLWAAKTYYEKTLVPLKQNMTKLEALGGQIQTSTCGEERKICVKIENPNKTYGKENEHWAIVEGQ